MTLGIIKFQAWLQGMVVLLKEETLCSSYTLCLEDKETLFILKMAWIAVAVVLGYFLE